jgi:hypothetical protein
MSEEQTVSTKGISMVALASTIRRLRKLTADG